MKLDKDLQSIQQVRDLIADAKGAAACLAQMSQQQLNDIVRSVAAACADNAVRLAKMAEEETGFGLWQDKILKNLLGSSMTYDAIKNMNTVGILHEDTAAGITEIGVPMGVIAALIPSTNPTSTVMYKCLISLKAGNSIIISPHPGALKCILETVSIIKKAAYAAGAPEGAIGCIELATVQATKELMQSRDVALILATGGEAMVRAAYSSGNPAIGVGPGNGPAFIEQSADIPLAVKRILDSKTFDNGTICASEQSIITQKSVADAVEAELVRQGGYFLTEEQAAILGRFILRENGTMNPKIVGKSVAHISQLAGISVPSNARVLIARQSDASKKNPYAREKLCPILAYYVEDSWHTACERCIEILNIEGKGHTMTIHAQDAAVIREFALKKPVSRLLVNTPGALGGVGATTNLAPALTLGCGTVGGSATSDNITPLNLINIRRVAYGVRELEALRGAHPAPPHPTAPVTLAAADAPPLAPDTSTESASAVGSLSKETIEMITKAVLQRLGG